MTSKLKCPVCQNNLHKINVVVSTCTNDKCKLWGSSIPNLVLKALTQAKQDLEIAKSTLEYLGYEFPPAYPEKNVIAEMRQKARNAVKYIEHKEQK